MLSAFFAVCNARKVQEANERAYMRFLYADCPHRKWIEKRGGLQFMIVLRPTGVPRVVKDSAP